MIQVDIITPDETVYSGPAQAVTLPTVDGEITVLGGHVPLITVLGSGSMVIRLEGEEKLFAVSRGVVEVTGTHLKVLADIADRADTLEEATIEQARARAEELRDQRRGDSEAFADATALLERELARLSAVRRLKSRNRRGF